MVIVVFGVSGSGKTTIGRLLAEELGWTFQDADEFHPRTNVEKMRRGISLTDADRKPWLERLRALLKESIASGENLILACSALKEEYRKQLTVGDEIRWVFLKGEYEKIASRLRRRRSHFMNPNLLRCQFETLEEPTGPELVVEVRSSPKVIVQTIRKQLRI